MNKILDRTGQLYGSLVVVSRTILPGRNGVYWECLCQCGVVVIVRGGSLQQGQTKSCGCRRVESIRQARTTHGMSNTKEYSKERSRAERYHARVSNDEQYFARRAMLLRRWRQSNPAKVKDSSRRYRSNHMPILTANVKARQASKLRAMPSWANKDAIKAFYIEAARITRETGIPHHVDHIIPLRGKYVWGFHVEGNLQVIPARENLRKNNKVQL